MASFPNARWSLLGPLVCVVAFLSVGVPRAVADSAPYETPTDLSWFNDRTPNLLGVNLSYDHDTRRFDMFQVGAKNQTPDDCGGLVTRYDWTLPVAADAQGDYAWTGSIPEGNTGFGPSDLTVHGNMNPVSRQPISGGYRYSYKLTMRIVQHNSHDMYPWGPCAMDSGQQVVKIVCEAGTFSTSDCATGSLSSPTGTDSPPGAAKARWAAATKSAKIVYNGVKGTAKLIVRAPSKGHVKLSGTGLKTVRRSPAKAGKVVLTAVPTGKLKTRLRHRGKATARATLAFAPTGGKAVKATRTLHLRRHR